jgi:hypothetical protein
LDTRDTLNENSRKEAARDDQRWQETTNGHVAALVWLPVALEKKRAIQPQNMFSPSLAVLESLPVWLRMFA